MKLFEFEKIHLYKKALGVYDKQHKAIARNVAHAHDATYKPVQTDFSDELVNAVNARLKKTHERHMNAAGPGEFPTLDRDTPEKVDINKEMGELAVNQIRFDFVARLLNKTYKSLNTSITGKITS